MNLQKMFEMQKALDERIIKEKGLEGQDLLPNLILALQVELAECANEWRGFKHWSNNQKPRTNLSTTVGATPENAAFFRCENDNCGEILSKEDFKNLFEPDYEECPICKVGYVNAFRDKNPLLEEYVDCLHFILSIGNRIGINNDTAIQQIMRQAEERELETKIGIGKTFSHLISLVFGFYFSIDDWTYVRSFERFLNLGKLLGFSSEQIEAAYMDKNAVNHQRQQDGY
ncbi:dUTP diphosphatase [Bacillus subtilis]|uniref:dUTP diphosphatase n=1 Tax=Bacillus subtilis TaxID=1423 RepID=UPI00203CEA82|nr:dUTP diphosphatase [Bacillus subtilis]MCM3012524.1 dUTP diphosphatase [Bacillus subtilis]